MEKTYYLSPIGLLKIRGSEKGIKSISFDAEVDDVIEHPWCLNDCVTQLDEYFNGKRKSFNLKFDYGGTDFQNRVWEELVKIPFGKTNSYLDIAKELGEINVVRAIGYANRKNPIAIIIPCHRVIGSNGDLTGYSGGLWRKQWLLNFENKHIQGDLFN